MIAGLIPRAGLYPPWTAYERRKVCLNSRLVGREPRLCLGNLQRSLVRYIAHLKNNHSRPAGTSFRWQCIVDLRRTLRGHSTYQRKQVIFERPGHPRINLRLCVNLTEALETARPQRTNILHPRFGNNRSSGNPQQHPWPSS